MSVHWIRMDVAMPDSPKVVLMCAERGTAGRAAAFVWVCSIAYAGAHGTDGFIPRASLGRCNGRMADARLLVAYEFWQDQGAAGWLIKDFGDYQLSLMDAQARIDRARKAALARWHGAKQGGPGGEKRAAA